MYQEFYYLDENNNRKGPLSIDQLESVSLRANTLVWTEGFDEWKPVKEVEPLKKLVSKMPPPPPIPIPKKETPQPVFTATSVIARNFRCDGCGSSLEIPKNARGNVKCKFCNNECILDGIIKNAEIAAKENINSGISLDATPVVLHHQLVSKLHESPYIPLDAFEKIEVVCEERLCVPAYCFECEGHMSFTYEEGQERKQTYSVTNSDNRVEVKEKTYIDWSTIREDAAITETIFVPGEKSLAQPIWCRQG